MEEKYDLEKAYKLIGKIKCTDMKENEDGSYQVFFDYDEKFKKDYKEIFNLKKFSKKHFQKTLEEAIDRMRKTYDDKKEQGE